MILRCDNFKDACGAYGCSIITMPPAIIEKISKFGKTYQELTLDTVKKFLIDSKDSNFKI